MGQKNVHDAKDHAGQLGSRVPHSETKVFIVTLYATKEVEEQ
jgi:hypothetical protein